MVEFSDVLRLKHLRCVLTTLTVSPVISSITRASWMAISGQPKSVRRNCWQQFILILIITQRSRDHHSLYHANHLRRRSLDYNF
jgi:hypothetical protein